MKHVLLSAVSAMCLLSITAAAQTETSPIISENSNFNYNSPITLTAKDANLSEIIRVLAERSGMNFVAGEGAYREQITLILNKTPLNEAINLLVRAAGLSYEVIGNSVLIAEPDKLKDEVGLSSYVVELHYAEAKEVAAMLKDLTQNIKIDEGGNRLICYTSPRVINEIARVVKSIDHPHILVLLETRLIEVSKDKLEQTGIEWSALSSVESGLYYPEGPLKEGFRADNWMKLPLEFDVALDILLQNGDATILMNSKLTTTNNREASLHIGEIVPYTIQAYNMGGSGGMGGNLQIMKENVGLIVTMTPHVNDDNQITLALAPEVSNIVDWKGEHSDIPLVRTRKTNTTIRVENGQKVLLAGLLSEEEVLTTHKIPVLGDIPILGLLFQNRREQIIRKNLIIEVIPRIIKDPGEIKNYLESSSNGGASSGPSDREPSAQKSVPAEKKRQQSVTDTTTTTTPEEEAPR